MYPHVDQYLTEGCHRCPLGGTQECKVHEWQDELKLLRNLILACRLQEEIKWAVPCYTYEGRNILLLSAFKKFCAVSFFKGALLKDPAEILIAPGKNSQAVRQLRFLNFMQIENSAETIKDYILEAIEIEKAGLSVDFNTTPEPLPEELDQVMSSNPDLARAFNALTPGRKRGYILYVSGAKHSKTRFARIKKSIARIMEGKGLHDR